MRTRLLPLLLLPVLVALTAAPAAAAPPSSDPATAADIAATWLAHQVNDQGFVPQAGNASTPNLSTTAQAALALASAGVGGSQFDAVLGYLGTHVDAFVVRGGDDDPGALAYLILVAAAAGDDPHSFGAGHADLVTRLENTRQSNGLFGAADATFDGAFRQGLALLALHAAGQSDTAASDWLAAQQCADGLWTPFRSDTSVACPAVDPSTFAGPDTNSTAAAVLGLKAQGRTAIATNGATALLAVRNGDGAWGFLAASDQPTDANSTGLVVTALRAANGTHDAQGTAALLALQVGCDGDPADVGGIAFQSGPNGLAPDALATAQAIPALAGVVLPLHSATITPGVVTACAAPVESTTTTTTPLAGVVQVEASQQTQPSTSGGQLPQSGSSAMSEVGFALVLIGAGGVAVLLGQDRRRRFS